MPPPIRTGSLRVIEPFPTAEDLEPTTVDVPSDEIAPGVTLEGGVMHVQHPDGSTTIDFDPPQAEPEEEDNGFYANLVDKIDKDKLATIATDLLDGIERDIQSRKEWLETRRLGIELLGLKLDSPKAGGAGSSASSEAMFTVGVRHPLLLDATVNFQATARGELLPAAGPVKVRNDTPPKLPSQSVPMPPASSLGPMAAGNGLPLPFPAGPPQPFQTGGAVRNADDDDLLGYKVRSDLFPGEEDYFRANPHVSGMAAETGDIILNPYSPAHVNRNAVAKNEAFRLMLRNKNIRPDFSISEAQRRAFKGSPYENQDDALRETLAARIYSGDPSALATDEQTAWLNNLLRRSRGHYSIPRYQTGGAVAQPQQQPSAPAPALPPQAQDSSQQQSKSQSQQQADLQQQSPFATELAIPPIEEQDDTAAFLERLFNHYLTSTAREYYPDTDRMLFYVGFGGDGFKKVYNCPLRRRPVSESVDAEDLIVSNNATDLANCGRVTHRVPMRKSILQRMQKLGVYRDIELQTPSKPKEPDPVKEIKDEIEGVDVSMKKPDDLDYMIYESYCELEWDDPEVPEDLKGIALPYRVTIEEQSREILSVIRNWKEDDEQALPKQFFVQYPLIRGLGFYGYGFIHLLGNTTATLTAMWREMTQAGMYANFPAFLYAKAAGRQLTNEFRVPPGGGVPIEVPSMSRLQDMVMPVPYKEPGGSFTAFAQWVEQAGQRLAQTGQIAVGEGKQEVPVGTTLALIEQATKIMNSAHKRLHAAQSEEFALLKERFREDPEAMWRYNKPAMQWEKEAFLKALDDYNIVPVADPNNPTSLHRAAKAQIIEALTTKYPQLINQQAGLKRVFRTAEIDTEGLFYDKPLAPPPDPRMVAINQKSQQTSQTVQAQTQASTQKAVLNAITALKQIEAKQQDTATRNAIEQARLIMEQQQSQADLINEQIGKNQELHHDRIQKAQELAADRASKIQELQSDALTRQQDARHEALSRAQERMSSLHDIAAERERHNWEMERDRQKHRQQMQHDREMHQAKLAQERALARIKKKPDNKGGTAG